MLMYWIVLEGETAGINIGICNKFQYHFVYIFQVLNDKFNGEIEKPMLDTFPDQYFTCNAKCQSCG